MHTSFAVEFDHAWLCGRDFPRERGRVLLRLLAELARESEAQLRARYDDVIAVTKPLARRSLRWHYDTFA